INLKISPVLFVSSRLPPFVLSSFLSPFHKGGLRGILGMENNWKISPIPSLQRGEKGSFPLCKGGRSLLLRKGEKNFKNKHNTFS
ncbi:MAG: hypothetical protein NC830_03095, partial [Candidatus Omnitrophica bacterium]|nr:hypothetical protein [Candidatus Omnitrophota bacterium]